jgi:hypothetical protein
MLKVCPFNGHGCDDQTHAVGERPLRQAQDSMYAGAHARAHTHRGLTLRLCTTATLPHKHCTQPMYSARQHDTHIYSTHPQGEPHATHTIVSSPGIGVHLAWLCRQKKKTDQQTHRNAYLGWGSHMAQSVGGRVAVASSPCEARWYVRVFSRLKGSFLSDL